MEYQSHGVAIKGYHTDNEIFNTSEFMEKTLKRQQQIRFSGDGASNKKWETISHHKDGSHYGKEYVDTR